MMALPACEERDDAMTTSKGATLLLTLLCFLVIPLAGCTDAPMTGGDTGDDGPPADQPPADDGPPPIEGECWPSNSPFVDEGEDRNYSFGPAYLQPQDDNRTHCWDNGKHTDESNPLIYFVAARESGLGEWEVTIFDGDGQLFRHWVVDAWEVFCNEEGVRAPAGNWTIVHEMRDLGGRIDLRLCIDPPPDDCFNRCP